MTRLTIIVPDGVVIVDGFLIEGVSLSSLPDGVRAVQWDTDKGHIEYSDGRPNENITDVSFCGEIVSTHASARNLIENPVYTKEQAAAIMIQRIAAHKAQMKASLFPYNGNNYIPDIESITATLNVGITMALADPILTPAPIAGKWKSADIDANGQPVLVPYTVGEFIQLSRALYDRNAKFWATEQLHGGTIMMMAADPAVTPEDIFAYDYTGGWE